MNKIKNQGQVYTPQNIVCLMLDEIGYTAGNILKKHIMDNSCGNGAFLMEIITRYIEEARKENYTDEQLKRELGTFIHGIEIDKEGFEKCCQNVQDIFEADYDILCADTLSITQFTKKIDYVIGNPPYVRVHNLAESFEIVKQFSFTESGMTDLYLVFFEIAFQMVKEEGKICLITPNSFFTSVAGKNLRKTIQETRFLAKIINLGHFQAFERITTYTAISLFAGRNEVVSFRQFEEEGSYDLLYDELFTGGKIVLGSKEEIEKLRSIEKRYREVLSKKIEVKNGLATLADKLFIGTFPTIVEQKIPVLKASTGEWKELLYPYDDRGSILDFQNLNQALQTYFLENKKKLETRSIDKKTQWFAFGRSQGLKDIYKEKVSVTAIIKKGKPLNIFDVGRGSAVYSGLYILSKYKAKDFEKVLNTEEFVDYVKLLGKYRSGGYYTFSSKDLEKYLIWKMEEER